MNPHRGIPLFLMAACSTAAAAAAIALATNDTFPEGTPRTEDSRPSERAEPPELPPFLEMFSAVRPEVGAARVRWTTATGHGEGVLYRQQSDERLPALLFIAGQPGSTDWYRRSARELAEIGFAVLAVDLGEGELPAPPNTAGHPNDRQRQERLLAELTAAVRWLRRQPGIFPDRLGAIGWKRGGGWAWTLAAATKLQAAVNCEGPIPDDDVLPVELEGTAVMGIWGEKDPPETATGQRWQSLQKSLQTNGVVSQFRTFEKAQPGFMNADDRQHFSYDDAEQAWFLIYEFLGEHVEDAAIKKLLAEWNSSAADRPPATANIADLMRTVNAATGLRGEIGRLLDRPQEKSRWPEIESRAALMVETATLLSRRSPPKGARSQWLRHVEAYRQAAGALHSAAQSRDTQETREALSNLGTTCGACHLEHR